MQFYWREILALWWGEIRLRWLLSSERLSQQLLGGCSLQLLTEVELGRLLSPENSEIIDRPPRIPGFCCSEAKLLEQKVLFLHFKLLWQRASAACSSLLTLEAFFRLQPARNFEANQADSTDSKRCLQCFLMTCSGDEWSHFCPWP
jgi:hypothetical protein